MLLDRPPLRPEPALIPADRLLPPPQDYDLVIVGGGLVGLLLAVALRDSPLKVAIVEALPQAAEARRAQAYAFSLGSAQIFQQLGLWEALRPHLEPFTTIHLSDANWPDVVRFVPSDLGQDPAPEALGYVVEHESLRRVLEAALVPEGGAAQVDWWRPARARLLSWGETTAAWAELAIDPVSPSPETAGVDDANNLAGTPAGHPASERVDRLRARLVVAADGSRSPLRTAAGVRSRGWAYWQTCLVIAVQPERSHQNIAYERFCPSGPFAILPLGETCRLVWTAPHAEAEALLALDETTFLAQLSERFGTQMGSLRLLTSPRPFRVQLTQSDRYVAPRLALVGEAAHTCHPVGGQGLNLGFRDAAALAEVLRSAPPGADVGSLEILGAYDRWRRPENLLILAFTDLLNRLFSTHFWPAIWLRRTGLFVLQRVQPLKTFALRLMTGQLGRLLSLGKG